MSMDYREWCILQKQICELKVRIDEIEDLALTPGVVVNEPFSKRIAELHRIVQEKKCQSERYQPKVNILGPK